MNKFKYKLFNIREGRYEKNGFNSLFEIESEFLSDPNYDFYYRSGNKVVSLKESKKFKKFLTESVLNEEDPKKPTKIKTRLYKEPKFQIAIRQEWYNNPDSLGKRLAKEILKVLEETLETVMSTQRQQIILSSLIDFGASDWKYFLTIPKKYKNTKQIYYLAKNIDTVPYYELFLWKRNNSGYNSDGLEKILEYICYMAKDQKYKETYFAAHRIYELTDAEIEQRYTKYHEVTLKKSKEVKFLSQYITNFITQK